MKKKKPQARPRRRSMRRKNLQDLVLDMVLAQRSGVAITLKEWRALDPDEKVAWATARTVVQRLANGEIEKREDGYDYDEAVRARMEEPVYDPELRAVLERGPAGAV